LVIPLYRETRHEPDDYAKATQEKSHLLVPEIHEPPVMNVCPSSRSLCSVATLTESEVAFVLTTMTQTMNGIAQ